MISFFFNKYINYKIRLLLLMGSIFPHSTRKISLHGISLIVPMNHMFDFYKSRNALYDHFLPVLCNELSKVSSGVKIIDIGANVGDTIALIRGAGVNSEIIAVEASSFFFDLLRKNISAEPDYYGQTRLIHAFVGDPNKKLKLTYTTGTAGASESSESNVSESNVIALDQIDDGNVGLVKIDTDGYDGNILLSSLSYIRAKKPILWAETLIPDIGAFSQWSDFIKGILGFYEGFYLFDNTGRPVIFGVLDQSSAHLLLNLLRASFVQKSLQNVGIGTTAISYYDLALFPAIDSLVWKSFTDRVELEVNGACRINIPTHLGY